MPSVPSRVAWRWLLVPAAAAAALALAPGATTAPAKFPPVDHFQCYIPADPPKPVTGGPVYTQDQFDQKPVPTKVALLYRFCNPVAKTFRGQTTPIRNPRMHLTLYSIAEDTATVKRTLVVSNQLGTQKMVIGPARWLAVPSSKDSDAMPSPKLLNHFVCYQVLTTKSFQLDVRLKDQWLSHGGELLKAALFCAPALKYVKSKPVRKFPIVDPQTHLTCYLVKTGGSARSLKLLNQFNRAEFRVTRVDLLCMPSKKLRHVP